MPILLLLLLLAFFVVVVGIFCCSPALKFHQKHHPKLAGFCLSFSKSQGWKIASLTKFLNEHGKVHKNKLVPKLENGLPLKMDIKQALSVTVVFPLMELGILQCGKRINGKKRSLQTERSRFECQIILVEIVWNSPFFWLLHEAVTPTIPSPNRTCWIIPWINS